MAERNSKGQFVKGHKPSNKGAGGRPKRSVEDKYLRALHSCVKIKDWKEIGNKATRQAKAGDSKARQWLSDYLLGKPVQSVSVEGVTELSIMLRWDDAEQGGEDGDS